MLSLGPKIYKKKSFNNLVRSQNINIFFSFSIIRFILLLFSSIHFIFYRQFGRWWCWRCTDPGHCLPFGLCSYQTGSCKSQPFPKHFSLLPGSVCCRGICRLLPRFLPCPTAHICLPRNFLRHFRFHPPFNDGTTATAPLIFLHLVVSASVFFYNCTKFIFMSCSVN